MNFSEFFLKYKLGVKECNKFHNIKSLPTYQKIYLLGALIYVVELYTNVFGISTGYVILLWLIITLIYWHWSNRKSSIEYDLGKCRENVSNKRINMLVSLLEQYNISPSDKGKIDLLINEAELAKNENNYLAISPSGYKIIGGMIGVATTFVMSKQAEIPLYDGIRAIFILFVTVCVLVYAAPILLTILYPDYDYYQKLIADLRQLKIFY